MNIKNIQINKNQKPLKYHKIMKNEKESNNNNKNISHKYQSKRRNND